MGEAEETVLQLPIIITPLRQLKCCVKRLLNRLVSQTWGQSLGKHPGEGQDALPAVFLIMAMGRRVRWGTHKGKKKGGIAKCKQTGSHTSTA